jgi:hypothetical protein
VEVVERTTTEMGEMGERFVQNGICKIPKNKVQGKLQFIRTLVIGISVNILMYLCDLLT